ncbi:MAG TPA: hypothetical protein VFH05_03820, partial [Nitrospira sp.]|nr:hypothetical protein [Nitrospira sp.]
LRAACGLNAPLREQPGMTTQEEEESSIRQEYSNKRYLYDGFCREALRQVDEVISREGIALAFLIEHRVKSLESILEKRTRMPHKHRVPCRHARCRWAANYHLVPPGSRSSN